ncbi:MAG: hypothetical protein QME94_19640, partial [Anaerolineae bacterium]|nr:hypothetical protein [Anaerolineae bacterium]
MGIVAGRETVAWLAMNVSRPRSGACSQLVRCRPSPVRPGVRYRADPFPAPRRASPQYLRRDRRIPPGGGDDVRQAH